MRLIRTLRAPLAFSLALHLGLVWLVSQFEPSEPLLLRAPSIIELVDRATPEERKQAQLDLANKGMFVRAVQLPRTVVTKSEKTARFVSDESLRVVKETRVANTGLTQNRSSDGTNQIITNQTMLRDSKPNPTRRERTSQPLARSLLPRTLPQSILRGDVLLGGLSAQRANSEPRETSLHFPELSHSDFERGTSANGEVLPADIEIGEFTALNTDRFLYYGFFSRVQESIRFHWERYARAAVYAYQESHKSYGRQTWQTYLEIILDREGRFQRSILHDSSGVQALDLAAVGAFRDAKQFPNPPVELAKEDGKIHLHYRFQVQLAPRIAAREQSPSDLD